MDTNRLKRFATEARNILMQGVAHRFTSLGFLPDGSVTEEPQPMGGGATFMGDTVSEDFYLKWCSLQRAVNAHSIEEIAEEAAYTWFNRLVAIRIMVKNGLIAPVLQYEGDGVRIPLLVSEARQGRMPDMNADDQRKLGDLLADDSQTAEQFRIFIVAFCHANPVINSCFGHISDYTELLLPTNILSEGGFVDMLNNTEFISEEDYHSPELIGWLYQFYISEKKDDVFASFKKGKKAEAKDIPAATQIFTPNWIVKYMVQNTIGRIYLDNNPYEEDIQKNWKYLVEPSEPTPKDSILHYDDLKELKFGDLACGSGHILNEGFDILYDLYILKGYSRKDAVENIFRYNLTGIDIDTRAKQLAQFALLLKACQKDSSFADAHIMPKVLDMPEPYDPEQISMSLDSACLKFIGGYENVVAEELAACFELMYDADTLGSIMDLEMDEDFLAIVKHYYEEWTEGGTEDCPDYIQALLLGVELILALNEDYSALVMNPPYMGGSNMNKTLSEYVKNNYPETKADLFSVFMDVAINRLTENGKYGMINMHSWMFLSSFERLRKSIIEDYHIDSLLHLGPRTFDELSGEVVQNSALVVTKNMFLSERNQQKGTYYRLVDGKNCADKEHIFLSAQGNHTEDIYFPSVAQKNFEKIPGCPIGYWVSENIRETFTTKRPLSAVANPCVGLQTADNGRFVRSWFEVTESRIGFGFENAALAARSQKKWFPYNKGGGPRRWYGNQEYIVNWEQDGKEIKSYKGAVVRNPDFYFSPSLSWSLISSIGCTFRYFPKGFLFDVSGMSIFNADIRLIGFLNTKVCTNILNLINPTINYQVGDVSRVPVPDFLNEEIKAISKQNIYISKLDWDSHETSWDFETNPIVALCNQFIKDGCAATSYRIENFVKEFEEQWTERFMLLHANEEELNRQLIDIYGLQDELTPDVPLDEITILQQGEIKIEDGQLKWNADTVMKQLISYSVGCMMGRYSIDKPGLILANQGDGLEQYNEQVPNSRFDVDDDGIVPLMSAQSDFADNATVRFKQWLVATFGTDTLVENLNFIEASLGKSIDDYFVKDFWKDHKKMYQNRPIYWLFSSKKGAFQCLAYMHRMDAYTAERIRTKYLLSHIEWLMQKQSEMEANAENLNARERKELDNLGKQIQECRDYHDRLHVIADEQIAFDLDDGVVVNYAKLKIK